MRSVELTYPTLNKMPSLTRGWVNRYPVGMEFCLTVSDLFLHNQTGRKPGWESLTCSLVSCLRLFIQMQSQRMDRPQASRYLEAREMTIAAWAPPCTLRKQRCVGLNKVHL